MTVAGPDSDQIEILLGISLLTRRSVDVRASSREAVGFGVSSLALEQDVLIGERMSRGNCLGEQGANALQVLHKKDHLVLGDPLGDPLGDLYLQIRRRQQMLMTILYIRPSAHHISTALFE